MRNGRFGWLGLAMAALTLGAASPAQAEVNIATGLKWVPLRYTAPIGAALTLETAAKGGLYGWQTTSLDNYIGFFPHEQVGIMISLDMGYANGSLVLKDDDVATSYFQFGFALGGKFYLNRPTAMRVSPYLYVDFYKYFASISVSGNHKLDPETLAYWSGLASPIGFNLAFGAEYFFTHSFSLGAEVLGLRFAYTTGTDSQADMTSSYMYFTFYTGISINYRFLASGSVRTYEEDEDRVRPRRPTVRPRPVDPPPPEPIPAPAPAPAPSPESVD